VRGINSIEDSCCCIKPSWSDEIIANIHNRRHNADSCRHAQNRSPDIQLNKANEAYANLVVSRYVAVYMVPVFDRVSPPAVSDNDAFLIVPWSNVRPHFAILPRLIN
jgi:hypothetical protein